MTLPENIDILVAKVIQEIQNSPFTPIGVSNRHIHLSKEDCDTLFGYDYQLTPLNYLQPGQYSCEETVTLIGKKGTIEKVRIIGPVRSKTQIEMTVTDSFKLGISPPAKNSGDIEGAAPVTIKSSVNGKTIERECVIVALRHIHMPPDFAKRFNFHDNQIVSVETVGNRGVVFNNVLIRVSEDFELEFHIDTDEANGSGIKTGDFGKIIS